ncbi:MAG: efflux RND transporter periplasmic adaptor subunit [Parachlamydiaceae bacterium]|nr:efflux RND transporter periplasmic adaptor subunit [Parachlamydiaceae bacterium]
MLNKIANITILCLSSLAIVAAFLFWKVDEGHDHDEHEHEHSHEELVVISDEQRDAAGITMRNAQAGNLQKLIVSHGKISLNGDRIAHIHPKVEGIAKDVKKNLGESVDDGEVIATLESREIAEAKTTYLTALKKAEQTATVLKQENNLYEKGVSSLHDYQTAFHTSGEALLNLELAKQKLQILGMLETEISALPNADSSQLRIYQIKAPLRGSVLSRHITTGELLKTDSEAYVISDLSNLWVDISFYPQDLPYVVKGQTIEISDSNGHQGSAKILYLSPVIDDDTRRAKAIASLDNSDGTWYPGTFVTATTAAESIPVPLTITKEAVQNIDGEDCIFIKNANGFTVRPIKLGRCDGKNWEVLSGIEPNESYASKNTFLLKADHKKDEAEHMD